jgi:hypothetical protein
MLSRFLQEFGIKAGPMVVRFDEELLGQHLVAASSLRVIIVSVKDLTSYGLRKLLDACRSNHRVLARLFLDEAHHLLSSVSFRTEFLDVGHKLRLFGVPIVAMTATAGPAAREALLKEIWGPPPPPPPEQAGLRGATAPARSLASAPVTVIQQTCHRTNMLYRVVHASNGATPDQAKSQFVSIVLGVLNDLTTWGKCQILIYAPSYDLCVMLRDLLVEAVQALNTKSDKSDIIRIGIYNGSLSSQDRSAVLDQFSRNELRILIGTSAISCGLNALGVGVVFHYGFTDSPEDYMQSSGRAARPGNTLPFHIGLSVLFFVQREYDQHLRVLSDAKNSHAAVQATRQGLMTPVQQAQTMLEYALLKPGVHCRREWLARRASGEEGDTTALSCDGRALALKHLAMDLARCDLCTDNNLQAHASALVAQDAASRTVSWLDQFEIELQSAESMFSGTVCAFCSVKCGRLTHFKGSAGMPPTSCCIHAALQDVNRCFKCGQLTTAEHRGNSCTVHDDTLGTSRHGAPESRCFRCLRRKEFCRAGKDCRSANPKDHTLGLAVIALEGLRANPSQFKLMVDWPLKLKDTILKAAERNPVTTHPERITALYRVLLAEYKTHHYCLAQLLLSLLAKTVQSTS